jgi:glycosyltransferase involved in cell wall biosynthesis
MKILHILTSINTGGMEKFCVDICNTQASFENTEVHLCILDKLHNDLPLLNQISDQVHISSLNKTSGYDLSIIIKLYQFIRKIKPNIIHINGRALIYASIPILLCKIPSIYTVHTIASKELNKYFLSYIRLLFNMFPTLFMPVGISHAVSKSIQNVYGEHFDCTIYNGSSTLRTTSALEDVNNLIASLKNNNDTLIFVSIGRIAPEKNTLLLIDAFNELLNKDANIALCIIGYDSTLKQDYLPQCQERNKYPNKIRFLGRKENIADYLTFADANCMTSTYEGLGITALESFSMGVPVLSTPSGGPSDIIIPGINGWVSDEITVESYMVILKKFISNPLTDNEAIVQTYKQNFTMEICAQKYLDLYQSRQVENS